MCTYSLSLFSHSLSPLSHSLSSLSFSLSFSLSLSLTHFLSYSWKVEDPRCTTLDAATIQPARILPSPHPDIPHWHIDRLMRKGESRIYHSQSGAKCVCCQGVQTAGPDDDGWWWHLTTPWAALTSHSCNWFRPSCINNPTIAILPPFPSRFSIPGREGGERGCWEGKLWGLDH